MANHSIVNQQQHDSTKIITQHSELYGDGIMSVVTFPFEFRNIQSCYPIFFQKDMQTGQFFPVALLGLQQGENLFLSSYGWQANYIPLNIQRQPFMIGMQNEKPVVTIDMDSPRVSMLEGELIFDEVGHHSQYFNNVINMLHELHQGFEHSKQFIDTLNELDLLEPFEMSFTLNNGSNQSLKGFYTIHEERAMMLDGNNLERLNKQGFLQPMFMAIASLSRMMALIEMKNKSLG